MESSNNSRNCSCVPDTLNLLKLNFLFVSIWDKSRSTTTSPPHTLPTRPAHISLPPLCCNQSLASRSTIAQDTAKHTTSTLLTRPIFPSNTTRPNRCKPLNHNIFIIPPAHSSFFNKSLQHNGTKMQRRMLWWRWLLRWR